MKIIVGKFSGFCIGVKKAIYKISEELNSKIKPEIYGDIIHNPEVVNALSQRGLKTINTLDNIDNKPIAIRSHGIPFNELKIINKRANKTINLTCSKVSKVQGIIKKYAMKGYHTILLGDQNHAEVLSLKSYASSGCTVISTESDYKLIPRKDKLIMISQTTLNLNFFYQTEKWLKNNNFNVKIFNTICNSTHNRQNELLHHIENDNITKSIIIGGKNSGNTKRLKEISEKKNIETYHIENSDELDFSSFENNDTVFITAGASTPTWIINNVINKLYQFKFTKSFFITKSFYFITLFFLNSGILEFLTAFLLSLIINNGNTDVFINSFSCGISMLAAFLIFSLSDNSQLRFKNQNKYHLINKLRYPISFTGFLILLSVLLLNYYYSDFKHSLYYAIAFLFFFTPALPFFRSFVNNSSSKIIKTIFSINILSSLFISFILLISFPNNYFKLILFSLLITTFILRNSISEIINYEGDIILGNSTLVNIFKHNNLKIFFTVILFLNISSALISYIYIKRVVLLPIISIGNFYILKHILNKTYIYEFKYKMISYSFFIFPCIVLNFILYYSF